MTSAKPYGIAKHAVWEAYQQVKANRGAAGVDDETIADFELDLSKNLYKLWNRMSSGSYFPPPVRQVEISKASGGMRKLGVPTVSDRVAQTVVKLLIEPELDSSFHPDWVSARTVGEAALIRADLRESTTFGSTGMAPPYPQARIGRSPPFAGGRRLQPTERGPRGQLIDTARRRLQRQVAAQHVVVAHVFPAATQPIQALREQLAHAMSDAGGAAAIAEHRRQAVRGCE